MEQSRRNLKRIHGGKVEIVYEVHQGLLEYTITKPRLNGSTFGRG